MDFSRYKSGDWNDTVQVLQKNSYNSKTEKEHFN
jgi:hypothetical protein